MIADSTGCNTMTSNTSGKHWKQSRAGFPREYAHIQRQIRETGVVGCYMLGEEYRRRGSPENRELVAVWPAERIAKLVRPGFSTRRITAFLALNRRTFTRLCTGEYTPSPALCRRMDFVEQEIANGTMQPEFPLRAAEARRRYLLFRAWWFSQPPRQDFPEITIALRVKWGKSKRHEFVIPVAMLPRLRLLKWEGLADVVQTVVKTCRGLSRNYGRLLWTTGEQEYWKRFARDTLPAVVQERAKFPAKRRSLVQISR
ncbi:MAG: hypothetical protein ABSF25_21780 [Bryobacteraceae bacterium]